MAEEHSCELCALADACPALALSHCMGTTNKPLIVGIGVTCDAQGVSGRTWGVQAGCT